MNAAPVIGFVAVVFAAVLVLMLGVTSGASRDARMRRTLRRRLERIGADSQQDIGSILREKYLTALSPFERRLEEFPLMERLAEIIEQSGASTPAYRVVISCAAAGVIGGLIGGLLLRSWIAGLLIGVVAAALPYVRIALRRQRRLARIEEQIPDAIDVIKRALRAGHPFNSSIKLVADDMEQPIAREFELTFSDLNYGNDVRRALLGLLRRVPSVSVMALVTSVLVQRESGGNLAEILEQIAKVVRARFRFDRKLLTLSAEGRISAWVLSLVPMALVAILSVASPQYLPVLLTHSIGHKLIYASCVLALLGIVWIRRIIRIEV